MNTTAAAAQANVTVATIRTWARRGVIAAVKVAGRWVINAASLARRIAIGARTRRTNTVDLTATYTWTRPGDTQPNTVTVDVRDRVRRGKRVITIHGLAPLLADRVNAISDEGNRLHTLTVLEGARIYITDEIDPDGDFDNGIIVTRDQGRLTTDYAGTRDIPKDVVFDLAERLRAQLWK